MGHRQDTLRGRSPVPRRRAADTDARGSLAERLRAARERSFVGRAGELAAFRAALRGDAGSRAVFWLHGPGGIGKSTLLRRFADEARDAGRPVVEIDGRAIDPSPAAFTREAGHPGARRVLLIDSFEHCQGLEIWLRDVFLPALPAGELVVIAGREAPSAAWTSDPGWSEALRVRELGDLSTAEATALLDVRGVAPAVRASVLAFAGGHPLALSLAATVPSTTLSPAGRDEAPAWRPTPEVLASLLGSLIGEVPSRAHRHALEVSAHALTTTEGLLRAVVTDGDAGALFAWLRQLPFVDVGRHGLFLHDLVREAVDADLRWRDPRGYEDMHYQVGAYLMGCVKAATTPAETLTAMRSLSHLKRYGPMAPYFAHLPKEGDGYEAPLPAGDHPAVLAMVEATEGPESARIAAHWLARRPESFRAYRRSADGALVGVMLYLMLDEPDPADPVVVAAFAHAHRQRPLAPGDRLGIARLMIDPAAYHLVSPVQHLMQLRVCTTWIQSERLAWSYILTSRPDEWRPLLEHLGHPRVDESPRVGGRRYGLFGCDWRVTPRDVWFDLTAPGRLTAAPVAGDPPPAPDRPEFDAAVRAALRDFHRPSALATSPLLRTRLVAGPAETRQQVEALRELLTDAVDALREDPRDARLHRTVATTFFHRVPTQVQAAQRLGLSFSTYRRQLHRGIERVCEHLWQRETGAAPG